MCRSILLLHFNPSMTDEIPDRKRDTDGCTMASTNLLVNSFTSLFIYSLTDFWHNYQAARKRLWTQRWLRPDFFSLNHLDNTHQSPFPKVILIDGNHLLWTELCAPLKFICQSPNPWYLRRWLYLKIGPLKRCLRLNEVIRVWALSQQEWCPYKRRDRCQGWAGTDNRPCEDTARR